MHACLCPCVRTPQVLSSFDKYRKEVASGQLDWSPMHTADTFWRENVDKFEERDFLVRPLLLLLLCWDLCFGLHVGSWLKCWAYSSTSLPPCAFAIVCPSLAFSISWQCVR